MAGADTNTISVTEVDTAIPEFWANVALGALQSVMVMPLLMNRDFENITATKGDVINVPKRGALAVNDKEAKKQITLQNPSNTNIPVALNKHKEVSWVIEDAASAKAVSAAIDYVQDAAVAIGEAIEQDCLGLYSELSLECGTPGTDLDIATILQARKLLNIAKCPLTGRVFMISPKDEVALLNLAQFTSAEWDIDNAVALKEATLGRKYGFTFIMNQNVRTSGTSPVITHNMAFQRDAFVLVTRPLPKPPEGVGAVSSVVEMNGVGVRVTRSYSQKDGGMLWTLDVLYGIAGMRDDTNGVDVQC